MVAFYAEARKRWLHFMQKMQGKGKAYHGCILCRQKMQPYNGKRTDGKGIDRTAKLEKGAVLIVPIYVNSNQRVVKFVSKAESHIYI
jgi:hypothetical protein